MEASTLAQMWAEMAERARMARAIIAAYAPAIRTHAARVERAMVQIRTALQRR